MKNGTDAEKELVRSCIEQGDESQFDLILSAITSSGALDYTRQEAIQAAERAAAAVATLPASPYKEALLTLSQFAVHRNH